MIPTSMQQQHHSHSWQSVSTAVRISHSYSQVHIWLAVIFILISSVSADRPWPWQVYNREEMVRPQLKNPGQQEGYWDGLAGTLFRPSSIKRDGSTDPVGRAADRIAKALVKHGIQLLESPGFQDCFQGEMAGHRRGNPTRIIGAIDVCIKKRNSIIQDSYESWIPA